jgi:beta-glucosidase-like glycosyl hydrolase
MAIFCRYVVSDCDAVANIYANHFYTDAEGSVGASLKAGMDVNCGETLYNFTEAALENNRVGMEDIDLALTRSFAVQFRLGMFDGNPLDQTYGNIGAKDVCTNN